MTRPRAYGGCLVGSPATHPDGKLIGRIDRPERCAPGQPLGGGSAAAIMRPKTTISGLVFR